MLEYRTFKPIDLKVLILVIPKKVRATRDYCYMSSLSDKAYLSILNSSNTKPVPAIYNYISLYY